MIGGWGWDGMDNAEEKKGLESRRGVCLSVPCLFISVASQGRKTTSPRGIVQRRVDDLDVLFVHGVALTANTQKEDQANTHTHTYTQNRR